MSTRPCANSGRPCKLLPLIVLVLSLACSAGIPAEASAAETIIVTIILNSQSKGEFFVNLADDGTFLVKQADLSAMGITVPPSTTIVMDNEAFVPLRSLAGVTFSYDEKMLSLNITAEPSLLPRQTLDLAPREPLKVYYPRDSSLFVNYGVDYFAGNSFDFKSLNISNEVGARLGDFLFLSDAAYSRTDSDSRFVRLLSSLVHDRRGELQRIVVGDFFANSGDLGAGLNLGGISIAKLYRINPYFINRPTVGVSGLVSLPSDLEIYQNGVRIRTDRLAPGGFDIRNITGYGGASLIEVVIRNPFGREQRLSYPSYYTDLLLKEGLHEYSYNIGAVRENFGTNSNDYGDLAVSAFHRYALSDTFNIGFRGEGTGSVQNLGPQVSWLNPATGIVTLSLSASHASGGKTGLAGLVGHSYQGKSFNSRLFLKRTSSEYATIDPLTSLLNVEYEADAGIGYGSREIGSINLDYASSKLVDGDSAKRVALTFSRNLTGNLHLSASYKRIMEPAAGNEFYLSLNYYPSGGVNLATSLLANDDLRTESLQAQKNLPAGEGFGFRALVERSDGSTSSLTRVNPLLQYNGPHGTYGADQTWLDADGTTVSTTRLSTAGAVAIAGRSVGLIRPVTDSFALVKVGEVPGVRVNLNNQELARTDSDGTAFIPGVGAFNYNQISINDKDVPMDYLLPAKLKTISPPYRSGSCVIFPTTKLQALTGVMVTRAEGSMKPLEFGEITMKFDDRSVTLQTGSGGEFYLDNAASAPQGTDPQEAGCAALAQSAPPPLRPGRHGGSVTLNGKSCAFSFVIPDRADPIIDLGQVDCSGSPAEPLPTTLSPATERVEGALLPASAPVESNLREQPRAKAVPGSTPKVTEAPSVPAPQPPTMSQPMPVAVTVPAVPSPPPQQPDTAPAEREIHFRFDSTRFTGRADLNTMRDIARLLRQQPELTITIEGHTDQIGAAPYNLKLGQWRAKRVRTILIDSGVNSRQITEISSFGRQRLKCETMEESCRKLNRRVVIRFNRGR